MTRCEQGLRIQDFLDGDLSPEEAASFRVHLAVCPECAAEAASFRRLITTLEQEPLEIPRADLSDRILRRVLPAQVRRRRLAALGVGYAAAAAVCGAGVALWTIRAAGAGLLPAWLSRHLLRGVLLGLDSLGASAVNLAVGWSWLEAVGDRLAPLSRALGVLLTDPGVAPAVWAAIAVCAALFWWMRPRRTPATAKVRHVGIVGF